MRRRSYLAGLGVTTATALAGCASDTNSGNGNDVSLPEQPSITAEDTNPDSASTTLEIRWNATAFDTYKIDSDTEQYYDSPDGEQQLIVQVEITNTGEETTGFVPGEMQVLADGTEAEWAVLVDGSRLDVDLEPGESVNDWMAFTIPEDTNEVVITIRDYSVIEHAAEFTHDESMEVDVIPYSSSIS
ncbi:DUF4352 domain-containing protein [Natrinema soli]|uniref:DUF4352 domain-containing protein n=1 Tax=Natrinema soli TaxID=1930624 RepID=A0ABD5SPD0_9EURY|nr:DUF4352 domain-containing protein [Natrinema soli]